MWRAFECFSSLIGWITQKMYVNKLNSVLVMAIIAYLALTPIDAVLYIEWLNTMTNYKWIAGSLIYPFFGLLFFTVPTLYKMWKGELNTNFPIYDLAKIGLMDSLGSIMAALTIPYVSIMLNVIISKLVLPMVMGTSYFVLKKRYVWTHYIGVAITIFGVMTAAIPSLVSGNDNTNGAAMFFFICSLIPGVASYIIKEMYLKENPDADSWYMNTVISLFQVGVGLLTLPLVMLPIPGLNIKPDNFGLYLSNSLKCQLGGTNTMDGDDCKLSFMYLLLFQLFGTAANILMFVIIKHSSSVTFIMINTLKTPITAMLGFAIIYYNLIKITEGESFTFTWLNVLGLVFVLIGSIFYGLNKEKTDGEQEYEVIENKENVFSSLNGKRGLLNPLLVLDDVEEGNNKEVNL